MNAQDRSRLESVNLSPEVIAKTEEVLELWEIDELFEVCSFCGKHCISPKVRNSKFRRKKPPAELFHRFDLGSFDRAGKVICWSCEEEKDQ